MIGETADEDPKIVALPNFANALGTLCVAEFSEHVGFWPRRFYFMTDVPPGSVRGVHAHKRLRQCLFCLKGAVTVDLERRGRRYSFRLGRPTDALLIPPGCWRELRDFAAGTVVGVLASTEYDPSDYIYEYDEFLAWDRETAARDDVPYLDLERSVAAYDGAVEAALSRVVASGRYIGGAEVEAFERAFAAACGVAHAVGVGNGLDALTIALDSRKIGPGDCVLVPANSFIATALAVSRLGAEPILVDVEPDTGNIDPAAAAAALTANTRAIIPVHLYGQPADMDPLAALADRHDLFLLEDAAQAHGARYRGRPCGSLGDAAAFSFYPTKNLGALGDAGAIVSDDLALIATARALANYGCDEKDSHLLQGVNSRLDPVQAAVLAVKLQHLDVENARRQQLAARYREGLADIAGVILPTVPPWVSPVWHVFCVRVAEGRRDALRDHLARCGIGTSVHYRTPIHLQPAYLNLGLGCGAFPIAERLAGEILSLPLHSHHSEAEIDRVIGRTREFFEPAGAGWHAD